jgi:hypothetical protein
MSTSLGLALEQAVQQAVSNAVSDAVAAALQNQIGPFLRNQLTRPQNEDDEVLLTTEEAAELIGCKPITLSIRRCKGLPPTAVKIGGSVRYRKGTLREFMGTIEPRLAKDGSLKMVLKKAGRGHHPRKAIEDAPTPAVSGAASRKGVRL